MVSPRQSILRNNRRVRVFNSFYYLFFFSASFNSFHHTMLCKLSMFTTSVCWSVLKVHRKISWRTEHCLNTVYSMLNMHCHRNENKILSFGSSLHGIVMLFWIILFLNGGKIIINILSIIITLPSMISLKTVILMMKDINKKFWRGSLLQRNLVHKAVNFRNNQNCIVNVKFRLCK